MFRTYVLAGVAAAVLAAPLPTATAQPDALDAALLDKAPAVLKHLKDKGYKTAGVLKFLVRVGDAPPSDNVGEVNLALADRLEVALLLADDPKRPAVTLLRSASRHAAESARGAGHLDAEGRKALFLGKYQPAWGTKKDVDADAFVTGLATVSKDLKHLTLHLVSFDATGAVESVMPDVTVPVTLRTLVETGHGYAFSPAKFDKLLAGARGVPKAERNKRATTEVAAEVTKADTAADTPAKPAPAEPTAPAKPPEPAPAAANPADAPVRFTVVINGARHDGLTGSVPEPKEGDAVHFELENLTGLAVAAVLKVNGLNTLYKETGAPFACRKWVLGPKETVAVKGFQIGGNEVETFKVLSPKESDETAVNYGEHAGTFRLTVFRGAMKAGEPDETPAAADEPAEAVAMLAVSRGTLPQLAAAPQSLSALQAKLRNRSMLLDGSRGLMVGGNRVGGAAVERVTFDADPDAPPIVDLVVRYYTPKGLPPARVTR